MKHVRNVLLAGIVVVTTTTINPNVSTAISESDHTQRESLSVDLLVEEWNPEYVEVSFSPETEKETIDRCENIFGWPLAGYSYVLPYAYWLKWEWNGSDLMLEYSFYRPANCNKAFWVTDGNLYRKIGACGIAVAYDDCPIGGWVRVTAVTGYSIWKSFGASYVANHVLLGYRR